MRAGGYAKGRAKDFECRMLLGRSKLDVEHLVKGGGDVA